MIPGKLYAGTTWAWTEKVPDYSAADGWSLKYIFTNASNAFSFTDDGSAKSTEFTVEVDAATTAPFTPGEYTWKLLAVKGSDLRLVSHGSAVVYADITDGATALDDRSHVKKTLDAIEAVIEGKATKDQQSYSVAGRSLSRMSWDELLKLRSKYSAEYDQEQAAARLASGQGNSNIVKATFSRPR